jgi:hypothetical protein
MHVFEFVLFIIAFSFLYKLVDAWVRHRGSNDRRDAESGRAELLHRLAQVEERVRVLERIVTDERFDLKQQFKDLGS